MLVCEPIICLLWNLQEALLADIFDKLCFSIPEILRRKLGELAYLTDCVFSTDS